jgi:hypothetical protein
LQRLAQVVADHERFGVRDGDGGDEGYDGEAEDPRS